MTPKKERVLAALMTHSTYKEAAEAAGITPRTLSSYLRDPEFRKAYKKASAETMDSATRQLQHSLTAAIDRLGRIVADDSETGAVQVSAAKTILDSSLKYTEFNDVLRELEATEDDDVL